VQIRTTTTTTSETTTTTETTRFQTKKKSQRVRSQTASLRQNSTDRTQVKCLCPAFNLSSLKVNLDPVTLNKIISSKEKDHWFPQCIKILSSIPHMSISTFCPRSPVCPRCPHIPPCPSCPNPSPCPPPRLCPAVRPCPTCNCSPCPNLTCPNIKALPTFPPFPKIPPCPEFPPLPSCPEVRPVWNIPFPSPSSNIQSHSDVWRGLTSNISRLITVSTSELKVRANR